jgi:hypothetical protein
MRYQSLITACAAATLSLSVSTPALAETGWRLETSGSNWRVQDTRSAALKWEIGFLALSAVDAVQTIECLKRHACEEVNPLFGRRPSAKTIILAKLGGGIVHFALFNYINDRNPKLALRAAQVSFALQGTVVLLNARVAF